MKDSETALVYLEFKPDGGYLGLSYYFASGNGCGYCAGGATSTVKIANGRIAGTLKGKDESRTFDVVFDLSITPDDHGAQLPADGGAPARPIAVTTTRSRDAKALRLFLSDALREYLDAAAKKGKAAAEMNDWAKEHPDNSVKIIKGFSNGDRAVLLIDGTSSVLKLTGEGVLVNEEGSWRVDDELTEVVLQ